MSKVIIILGANGALGRAVSKKFKGKDWKRVLCDVSDPIHVDSEFVRLPSGTNAASQYSVLKDAVLKMGIDSGKVNAVVNVGGGFRMDNAAVRV